MIDFQTSNYYLICFLLDERGVCLRDIAQEARVSVQHVTTTLQRYCGMPRPRGPQSEKVRRILAAVERRLEHPDAYPPETNGSHGASLVAEAQARGYGDLC